jgi:hypothetical protein
VSGRTRVLYGICRQCKAVCEKHVGVTPEEARVLKIALIESDLIPRDLYVDDTTRWPIEGCAHHPGVTTTGQTTAAPAPTPTKVGTFPAARDGA